ncbi:DUF962 domain-containing protein [Shewanella gelidii]|uniref:DUF962 domain-containing protein n=1 Tax=Shewanella gelidii TaxID=1642821 RepID=A0A917N6K0_9GAMM|nr:Mpo1-like protein [Shewanella gelidii]MCL1096663.1 DUF962 domain-containing protein [Shewanella gelidii]GGI69341.1 hypothetical protein GCM10009332_02980 [Shewanella gelidii]
MKSAVEQLATYKSVHLNPKNIQTHFVGVPLIIWSLFLALSLVDFDLGVGVSISLAVVFAAVVLVYYFILHVKLAFGLTLFILPVLLTSAWVAQSEYAIWIAVSVFIIAWAIQFVGHHYEKAKPAFADDINQLLIGPFFLMAELYFMFGLEQQLAQTIKPLAIEKRRALEAARKKDVAS